MSIMDNLKDFLILESNRLILRKCMNEYLSAFYRVASNQNVAKWITWDHHKSKDETQSFIDLLSGKFADMMLIKQLNILNHSVSKSGEL